MVGKFAIGVVLVAAAVVQVAPAAPTNLQVIVKVPTQVPVIASLSPTSGAVGATVTITGSGFNTTQGSGTVTFNGTAVTSVLLWTNPSIVVLVPTGATTGNVVVTQGGVASAGMTFTVSGYPDATNTGWEHTGVTLTNQSGNQTISIADTVVDSVNRTGCITVNANGVTIKRSKITLTGGCGTGIDVSASRTDLLIEDVEIDCLDDPGSTAINFGNSGITNLTVRRVNAYGCENTIWTEFGTITIEDSYLHDNLPHDTAGCPMEPGPNCHTDGIQIPGSQSGTIVIQHNRIYGGYIDSTHFGNAAITMAQDDGPKNITINNNILAGGGQTLYCGTHSSVTYTNNRFSTVFTVTVGGYAPIYASCASATGTWTGNVCHETDVTIPQNNGNDSICAP